MPIRIQRGGLLASCTGIAILGLLFALDSDACPRLFRLRRHLELPCPPAPVALVQTHEWPMLGGSPRRNMVNLFERDLPTEWNVDPKTSKNIKWVAKLGSRAYGSPVIAGGRVFIGTNNQGLRDKTLVEKEFGRERPIDLGVMMCFRESDGAFLWQAVHKKLPGGIVNDWPLEGICSTPVVEGDRLYYVSNRCEVVCADVANGKAIWTLDMIGQLGVFPHNMSACSPLIVDDLVMVVTANGVNESHTSLPAPRAPSFVAVNKRTGKVVWQDNSPTIKLTIPPPAVLTSREFFKWYADRGEVVMHGQWSNPAFGVVNGQPQVVFPGGNGWLYSFEPKSGKLLWRFDCNPKDAKFGIRSGARSEFIATPVIHQNRVYIGVGQDPEHRTGVGHLWCIDMTRRGDVSAELRNADDAIVKNPNSAVVWYYGGPIADSAQQKKLRRYYHFGRTMSTVAVHDGLVYAADLRGILHCLDADTGKVQWEHDLESDIWSSPFYADGKVYLGSDDGTVFVFQQGRSKKLLAENDMEGRVRSAVTANNGVLYVVTENRLYAIAQPR